MNDAFELLLVLLAVCFALSISAIVLFAVLDFMADRSERSENRKLQPRKP